MSDVPMAQTQGSGPQPSTTCNRMPGRSLAPGGPLLCGDLVFDAMRIAEWAHRTRYSKGEGAHHRKAPAGLDRPAYFLHLAQVAWMLESARLDEITVAAGYLHDTLEDTDLSAEELRGLIGDARVVELVKHVTEPPRSPDEPDGFEKKNAAYLEKIRQAPPAAVALSCADKTANLIDFTLLMRKGCPLESFASRGFEVQLSKFERLAEVFRSRPIPAVLQERFERALPRFRDAGEQLKRRSA